ncbi:hypothetical protein ALC62_03913 [Cyphomyrmex costatus]|uniref:Uncharacterized protein n=1 Tax=Cyphomyrmex costatus TaxID=456900 RepID=A0A151IKP9_9HYME|nr:hypothetical protein ALC62_03913 [Cyphomyrmex costatus]
MSFLLLIRIHTNLRKSCEPRNKRVGEFSDSAESSQPATKNQPGTERREKGAESTLPLSRVLDTRIDRPPKSIAPTDQPSTGGEEFFTSAGCSRPLINEEILFLKNSVPADFSRLPRSLEDIEYFKATELRQFLLYVGPIVLRNMRNKNMYTHFMTLSCAIRILCSHTLYFTYNNYALQLIKYFIQKYSFLYGPEFINHNVHGLVHLPADCLLHGPLDMFTCFKYENFLYQIKQKIQTTRCPLQQICNRLREQEQTKEQNNEKFPILYQQTKIKIINGERYAFYKKIQTEKFTLSTADNENCIMIRDESILCIDSIFQNISTLHIFITARKFLDPMPFFNSPCSFKLLNIYQTQSISEARYTVSISEVQAKCVKFLLKNNFVIMAMIHTN